MKIVNILVEKIEKDHPRYPANGKIPFTEVYRCEATPANACKMLELFGRAISRLDEVAVA